MAKTESTAVNELIELVTTQKPLPKDPDEDLMFTTPRRKLSAARMSATQPELEVAPLPRARAPQGTQQGPVVPERSSVRVSTAPRITTIPPIPGTAPRPQASPPPFTRDPMRQTKPSLPPAIRPSAPRMTAAQPVAAAPIVTPATPPAPPAMPAVAAQSTPPAIPGRTAAPSSMPVAAPFESAPSGHILAAESYPAPPMVPPAEPYRPYGGRAPAPSDMTSNQAWFDQNDLVSQPVPIQQDIGTDQLSKPADWKVMTRKLIVPMLALVIIGVFIGGYIAFDGDGGKPRTASAAAMAASPVAIQPAATPPAPPAQPAPEHAVPAVAPAEPAQAAPITPPNLAVTGPTDPATTGPAKAEPVKPEAAKPEIATAVPVPAPEAATAPPSFVDVRIDSKPSGATVMLVDRGKTTFLGTTPVSAAVDPSRSYDLVFTYANKPTQLEHLDASTTKHVAVVLGKAGNQAAPVVKRTESKPAVVAMPRPDRVAKPRAVKAAVVDPFETKHAAPVGEGVLMISSKPPCEILVDGKPTGLMTPQRAIKLAAGTHKVTLVNATEKIKKTVAVQITADQPTKVIQDLMK